MVFCRVMILMTGAVLMAPNRLYLMFWLPGVFLVITAVVGTKLQLCSLQMATYSKELQESVRHSDMFTPPGGSLRGGETGTPYPPADDDDGDDGAAGFSHRLSDLSPRIPLLDAASLFWFSRPRLLLKLLQYTLFENSLSFALTIYSYWKVRPLACVGMQLGVAPRTLPTPHLSWRDHARALQDPYFLNSIRNNPLVFVLLVRAAPMPAQCGVCYRLRWGRPLPQELSMFNLSGVPTALGTAWPGGPHRPAKLRAGSMWVGVASRVCSLWTCWCCSIARWWCCLSMR
jgi:hypothetical protein